MSLDNATLNPSLQTLSASSLLSPHFDPNAMTPEGLMVYLGTRMGSLDDQMTTIMDREKKAQRVRAEIGELQTLLAELPSDDDKQKDLDFPDAEHFNAEVNQRIENIKALDPKLGASIEARLNDAGQIGTKSTTVTPTLSPNEAQRYSQAQIDKWYEDNPPYQVYDTSFKTGEVEASKDYLGLVAKDLESGSQMDMIGLQSLMSARQTAIQLATNLLAALNDSAKSVVGNIR